MHPFAETIADEPRRSPAVPDSQPPVTDGRRHLARGLGVAAVGGVAFYALLASGVLGGAANLVLMAVVLVAVPTAPSLARRVALNGALFIGWTPVLWWVRWPFDVSHGAVVSAFALGLLVLLVASSSRPAERTRDLLPTLQVADGLIVAAGLAAVAAMHDWAFAGSPRQSLVTLLPGVDNVAHFMIFSTLRAQGADLSALGPPDGTAWAFHDYPVGFHTLIASISEVSSPHLERGPDALVAYTHGVAALVVLGTVVLVASLVSIPALGRRPAIAAPVVVVMCMAYLWEPGQKVMFDGFASFWLGAAAASCVLILCLSPQRPHALIEVVAMGGLLVCVANTWTPLLVVTAPGVLVLLLGRDDTWSDRERRRRVLVSLLVLGVSGLAVLKGVAPLLTNDNVNVVVTATGGITGTSPLPTLLLFVTAIYVCLSFPGWIARGTAGPEDVQLAHRVRLLALAPVLGLVALAVLFAVQLHSLGSTSYYFLKYLVGVELILAGFTPAVAGMLVAVRKRPSRSRRVSVALGVAAVVVATQAFGLFPRADPAQAEHPGGTAAVGPPYSVDAMAEGVVSAAGGSTPEQSFGRDYVALGANRAAQAFYPNAWYHAVLASATDKMGVRLSALRLRLDGVSDALPVVRAALVADPDLEIVVAPTYVTRLRERLESPALAERVIAWDEDEPR